MPFLLYVPTWRMHTGLKQQMTQHTGASSVKTRLFASAVSVRVEGVLTAWKPIIPAVWGLSSLRAQCTLEKKLLHHSNRAAQFLNFSCANVNWFAVVQADRTHLLSLAMATFSPERLHI